MKKVLTNLTAFVLAIMLFSVNVFAGEYVDETELSMVKVEEYNSHTYAIYHGSITWEEARAWCENNGGHLVTITSREEQSFIESFNSGYDYLWIGAYRERVVDWEWKWVTGEKWDYTNWAAGEPNDSPNVVPDENCVVLWPMEWNDLSNENIYEQWGFICEWDNGSVENPTEKPTEKPTEAPTEKPTGPVCEITDGVGFYNNHTYAIYRCFITWEDAEAWCEANGGHLVAITNAEEQQFIERLNDSYQNLWIGAYREQVINWEWKWVTGEEWGYTNWAEGEPNNSPNVVPDEYSVTTWPMAWNDLSGRNTMEQTGFICEWDYFNDNVPSAGPDDSKPPSDEGGDSTEEKPTEDDSDGVIETKPERVVEMEITTTLKESADTEVEAEVTVHIELTELTDGNVEDSKVFIRATGADGAESIQSFTGDDSIDVDVPVSKRVVKVFCFESLTTLKPLCEAQIIEIEY